MPRAINKCGFIGVRKKSGKRRRPYYARVNLGCNEFLYSRGFATAKEAGDEFLRMKSALKQT